MTEIVLVAKPYPTDSVDWSTNGTVVAAVRALWDFVPQSEDHVGFPKGAIVEVVAQNESKWWMGKYEEKTGLFPINYTEVYKIEKFAYKTVKLNTKKVASRIRLLQNQIGESSPNLLAAFEVKPSFSAPGTLFTPPQVNKEEKDVIEKSLRAPLASSIIEQTEKQADVQKDEENDDDSEESESTTSSSETESSESESESESETESNEKEDSETSLDEPTSVDIPSTDAQSDLEPEIIPVTEPATVPEVVTIVESEPIKDVVPDNNSIVENELVEPVKEEPEPIAEFARPESVPEIVPLVESVPEPEPAPEVHTIVEPEPINEPEPIVEIAQPESVPEIIPVAEPVPEPEPAPEVHTIVEPEPINEPEPIVEIAQPEPINEPEPTKEVIKEPAPVVEEKQQNDGWVPVNVESQQDKKPTKPFIDVKQSTEITGIQEFLLQQVSKSQSFIPEEPEEDDLLDIPAPIVEEVHVFSPDGRNYVDKQVNAAQPKAPLAFVQPERDFFEACTAGDLARVTYLVEKTGQNVNATNAHKSTGLHCAAKANKQDVIIYLLANGARVDILDSNKCLPHSLSGISTSTKHVIVSHITKEPEWIPDSTSNSCLLCNSNFSFFFRRHHCRSCGILCCKNCSSQSVPMPKIFRGANDPKRACAICATTAIGHK